MSGHKASESQAHRLRPAGSGRMGGTPRGRAALAPRGFTLVELLIVITIIGMLASISLAALAQARSVARRQRTKATIAKLNDIIMSRYASYATRRVPISTSSLNPQVAARVRLTALRDLMRMEMPERWYDVIDPPLDTDPFTGVTIPALYQVRRPALSRAYYRAYTKAKAALVARGMTPADADDLIGTNGSAECLYMVVNLGDPDARESFPAYEVGDTDGDTLPEFIDGWGNSIRFLRWAPAFNDSDVQPNIIPPERTEDGTDWTDPANWVSDSEVSARMLEAQDGDHDPFDPQKRDVSSNPGDPAHPPSGWRVLPLIYSAGPDGIYDISTGGPSFHFTGIPCTNMATVGPPPEFEIQKIGLPVDSRNTSVTAPDPPAPATKVTPNSLDHYDNITNHRIEAD